MPNSDHLLVMPPGAGLLRILEHHPDFLDGAPIANLGIDDIEALKEETLDATDFLAEQFFKAVGYLSSYAIDHRDKYDIREIAGAIFDPKIKQMRPRRTFSQEGLQIFKQDVIKFTQHLCNGATAYFNLLGQCRTERRGMIAESAQAVETQLLDHVLQQKSGKILCLDFITPHND